MSVSTSNSLRAFRERHPTGTVVAELVRAEAGIYVVRAEVRIDRQTILGSGLAVHADLEQAEERAMERALAVAGFVTPVAGATTATSVTPERTGTTQIVRAAERVVSPEPGYLPTPLLDADPVPNGNGNGNGYPVEMEPPVDLSDILAQTDVQMKRIGWGSKEGRDYLQRTFGKSARAQLDEVELQEFLAHLKSQPNHLARRSTQAPF